MIYECFKLRVDRGTSRDKHVKYLSRFVSMAFGKQDAEYSFSQRGVDNLTVAHQGLGITSTHFNIVCSHLQKCLEVCSHHTFFLMHHCTLRSAPAAELRALPTFIAGPVSRRKLKGCCSEYIA